MNHVCVHSRICVLVWLQIQYGNTHAVGGKTHFACDTTQIVSLSLSVCLAVSLRSCTERHICAHDPPLWISYLRQLSLSLSLSLWSAKASIHHTSTPTTAYIQDMQKRHRCKTDLEEMHTHIWSAKRGKHPSHWTSDRRTRIHTRRTHKARIRHTHRRTHKACISNTPSDHGGHWCRG
jgi:hypothetical protein